ncbi:MAG: methyltransferase domain-containing protein [Rhodobiaceae bacterium]|nr:methyltransferase domain-containing protein [Rhodobiaceae bacterium]MCC0013750.1 methyltransferase domain-containing protein [Rhodobiaceae bacterium]MCC0018586.1 methyltransferase domain-containing protein [Rhodobiaceae bacterium]MCC0062180.1 methyltransferase domain-containing protein [Rhodobiaceae bacterium]
MAEAITEQGRKVAAHWSGLAITYEGAVEVLRAAGIDPAAARAEDLHAIDMIHMGGLAATDALAQQAGISPGERVLDVGAGVGGSSRRFADRYGAIVTSVELSETLARTAERLNELVGLSSKVTVMNASALSLPVESANFDVVVMQHVAMQIAEKDQLFGELSRALAPGGRLALHEIFSGEGELRWPLAWATDPSMSALEPLESAMARLRGLGLSPGEFVDESELGQHFHLNVIERWGPAADANKTASGLAPEVLKKRVAASRAMEHNLRVGSLRVGRLVAVNAA